MRAFVGFIFTFFAVFTPASLPAQNGVAMSGEIHVSEKPVSRSRPMIALRGDGHCWVVWADASQFLLPGLGFDGQNRTDVSGGSMPAAFPPARWGAVQMRCLSTGYWPIRSGWDCAYKLVLYDGASTDTIGTLFGTSNSDNPNNGQTWDNTIRTYHLLDSEEKYIYSYNLYWGYDWLTRAEDLGLTIVDKTTFRTHDINHIHTNSDQWPGTLQNKMGDFTLSPMRNGSFALLKRLSMKTDSLNGVRRPYRRLVDVYNMIGDVIASDGSIDTLAEADADYADRIVTNGIDEAYFFHRHHHRDSVFVQRIGYDGVKKGEENFLAADLVGDSLYAQYETGFLSNDRYFIVWTGVDAAKDTNVFIAILDKDMNIIAGPNCVNGDRAGMQCEPFVATKGDSVYVAWLDTRSGTMHVYLRMLTPDDVTAAAPTEREASFGIDAVAPNPVRESARVSFTVPSGGGWSLTLYDAFGRDVRQFVHGPSAAGAQSVQFSRDGLASGTYLLALRAGARVRRHVIAIVK